MANKEKFLLVSLKESQAKQLAQTISNETARKILDFLADKEATESELAKKLELPISTVHYNIQQLQKGGLVVSEEYHYSQKGKEINHYKLANKYIIIAPKSTYGIKEKLKSVLPVALIAAAGAGLIQLFSGKFDRFAAVQVPRAGMMAEEAVIEAAPALADAAPKAAEAVVAETAPLAAVSSIALWFFIGAAAAIILYLLIDWIRNRKK